METPAPVALVGSGEFLPVMDPVDRLLLDGRPPKVVFLPTAAGEEAADRVDYWVNLGLAHYRRLGIEPVPLRVLDRAGAEDPELAGRIAGAGLVYLSGGNPGYLADTLRGTRVLDAIVAAHHHGAALAGCSAGACALTAVAEDMRRREARAGLRVVPGLVVVPHFDVIEEWWPGIIARRTADLPPGQVLVGVDEETALVGGPRRWTVHGRRHVWVVDGSGARRGYPAGSDLDIDLPG